jgi:hypothetical protein
MASVGSRTPGWGSDGFVLVDLDGDGALELVSAQDSAVEVRRMLPGGALDAGEVTTLASAPRCLATGDVDGDGRMDVVAAMPLAGEVAVLLGAGDGQFAVTTLALGSFESCALGDLDGDGRPDLVATSPLADTVWVALNDGRGGFGRAIARASDRPGPARVALADVDRDRHLDVVVINDNHHSANLSAPAIDNGSVTIWRGVGDGTLGPPATFAAPAIPFGLAIADLTGDGMLDVLVGGALDATLAILPGDGAGGLLPPVALAGVRGARDLTVGDLDGDGLPDILVDVEWSETQVLWNLGGGAFSASLLYLGEGRMHVADVTGDGVADVVLAGYRPRVLVQEGCRRLAAASHVRDGNGGERVLLADMDGDGRVDLVAPRGAAIAIGRGAGDGTFQPPILIPTSEASPLVAVGDLDGDGLPEIVHAGTSAQLRRNLGGFAFGPEESLSGPSLPMPQLLDVDGDGDLDLVLAFEGTALGYWDSPVEVRLNDGAGNLGGAVTLPRPSGILPALPSERRGAAAGDLDGDGIADLAVSRWSADVTIFRGLGGGAFDPASATVSIRYPTPPVILDVTGDGVADLVVASHYPRFELRVYPGGRAGLGAPIVLPLDVVPLELLAVDVDSDGRKDLVVSGNGLAVFRSLPGGGLAPAAVYADGYRPGLAVADLTGDLRPDVVLGMGADVGGYAVLANRCLP